MKLAEAIKLVRSVKISHAQKFAEHVVPEVVRPARVIWNQAIGAIFLLFAISFASYAVLQSKNPAGMIFGVFLALVMGFFAATSFIKARQISRR